MASTSGHVQASLITSFFKSPPKEAEVIEAAEKSPLTTKADEDQVSVEPTLQSSSTADWDVESDGADSDSSRDLESDDCSKRKPLVVSLCDLLSPEVMAPRRPRQGLSLQKKERKGNQSLFTDYLQTPPTSSQNALDFIPPSLVTGDTCKTYSYRTKGGGQGKSSCVDDPKNSTDTQVVVGTDLPSQTRETSLPSALQGDQCSMEVPSSEVLSSQTVQPEKAVISGATTITATSGSLKQSTLVRSSDSGLLHVVKPCPELSEQGKQQQQQTQEPQCEEDNTNYVTEQIGYCSPDRSEPQNDSFEDFQVSRTSHTRKLKQKLKSEEKTECPGDKVPSPCAPEAGEALPWKEPAVKRPRRAAAAEARKKSFQFLRRRSSRLRSGFPSEDAEEKGSSSPPQRCDMTSEIVTVTSEASDSEVENGIVIVSSTPPTTLLTKQHSLPAPFRAGGMAESTLPPPSSAILSTEWAKIFKQPVKQASSGIVEVVEVSSGVTEEEDAMSVSPKPRRTNSRKRSLSCSPLRQNRSRSSSPRFGSRPGSPRSPLRHPSPLRISSPRRTAVVKQSPLKASLSSARQLPFTGTPCELRRTDSMDCAPFRGLVHERQEEKDDLFWKLPAPRSVPVQRGWGKDSERLGVHMTGSPCATSHGLLGLCNLEPSADCVLEETPPSTHGFAGSDKLLSQLQEAHPEEKVGAIFDRYQRILCDKREGEREERSDEKRTLGITSTSHSRSKEGGEGRRETAARRRKVNGATRAMKVSIRTCVLSEGGEKGRIQVDSSAYKRQSRRLSRNRNRTTSKPTPKELHEDCGERPDHSLTSTPTCSPAFQSELWTEIYRPQKSSEVIGNRSHVEQLLAWLEAWKRAKGPTQSLDKVGQTSGSSARLKTGSCSNGSKKSTADLTSSEKADKAQFTSSTSVWANDTDDSDFVSISHLKRKRGAMRCPNSSDSDDGGIEGEGLPCPVTLLCGDHGCGKTAAVYACAQELGYKVFEVNSTTVRSRQNVVNTLREATLSHQVATRPKTVTGGIAGFFRQTNAESKEAVKQEKQVKPHPASAGSLYSFFKPTTEVKDARQKMAKVKTKDAPSEDASKQERRTKRKRRRKSSTVVVDSSSDEGEPQATPTASSRADNMESTAVSLASATVILLEEVDVLFEEERGFWTAVYDIIETSKRPIIMTCSDHRYELYCDHEKLAFTQPSLRELSLHMQLLCLSHGCHLTAETANQIAAFLNCDIRSVFNCLQFWLSFPRQAPGPSTTPATTNSQEVFDLTKSRQSLSIPLQLDHLLGLSSVDQGHRPTADLLEIRHQAGLETDHPITTVVPQLEGYSAAKPLSFGDCGSHLVTPWRCSAMKKMWSHRYRDLDAMSSLCDDFSFMDAIASGSCDPHVITRVPDPTPWWSCRPQTGLSEEPATGGPCGDAVKGCQSVVATMEALVRERVTSNASVCGSGGDVGGLTEGLERRRRMKALHTAYCHCSEVFGITWEASHSAMSVDGLPVLKVICASENTRQEANTKRRFRHYLQASVVDPSLLKSFPRTTSFVSTGTVSGSVHCSVQL